MSALNLGEHLAREAGLSLEAAEIGQRFASWVPQPNPDNGLGAAAVWWAHNIGAVIPLGRGNDPDWAKKANPHLLGEGWTAEEVATRNLEQVREWWREDPMVNIGFVTKVNGVLIVDLDPRHRGVENWSALCEEHGFDWTRVPRSSSPALEGGAHLWFRLPAGSDYPHSPLARGVDRPWQVPVPPSLRQVVVDPDRKTSEIRAYTWTAGDPRELPEAQEWMLGGGTGSVGGEYTGPAQEAETPRTERGAVDVDKLAETGVPMGSQSYVFKKAACSMVRQGYSEEQIVARLHELADASAQRPGDPWTDADLRYMTRKAEAFVEEQRRQEQEATARLVASLPRRF